MKRGGAIGSAFGMMAVAALLIRGGAAPEPVSQSRPVTVSRSSQAITPPEAGAASARLPEDGPWRASRDHFAGIDRDLDCLPDRVAAQGESASNYTMREKSVLEHGGGLI